MIDVIRLQSFEQQLGERGMADNTIQAYVSDARMFANDLNAGKCSDAIDWLRQSKATKQPATVQRRLTSLRLFYKLCYGIETPFPGFKTDPPARSLAHPLPNGWRDVDALVRATHHDHHKLLIALGGYAGLRIHEARQIGMDSLIEDASGNRWVRVKGKGGKTRHIPISPRLQAVLDLFIADADPTSPDYRKPFVDLNDSAARAAIRSAGRKAGFPQPVASHDLRMTFGTEMYARTKDLRVVQELLGHSSPATTERYTGISEDALMAAVKRAMP